MTDSRTRIFASMERDRRRREMLRRMRIWLKEMGKQNEKTKRETSRTMP